MEKKYRGQGRASRAVRWLALACLIGLLGAFAAGCGPVAPAREPVTISFAFPEVDAEHYAALAAGFAESHPQITVELLHKTGQELAALEPESADVLWVPQDAVPRMSAQDAILNLRSLIEQDEGFQLADFYEGALDALSREGETWAIPAGADVVVMYYNRDLFDEYGVPYPEAGWTWDDLLERAVALRDPDVAVFGYGPRIDLDDATYFVYQHGGRILDDLENPTRTTFDDPLTIEALDWYARMVHEYDAAPSLNQAATRFGSGSWAVHQGILQGKVGMWMGGLSERGGLVWPIQWQMAWGMVPLPNEAQSATQAIVEGYAISSSTAHHDACWAWIAWLSEQVHYRLVPARRSVAESAAYEDAVGDEVAAVARASMEHAIIINSAALSQFERAFEAYDEALRDILQGHQTPMEAMSEAQREAQ
jgi:multiple sugar transport system substrate-binding protein